MRLFDELGYKMCEVGCKLEMVKTNVNDFARASVNNTIGNGLTIIGKGARLIDSDKKKVNKPVEKKEESKEEVKLDATKEKIYRIIADEIKCWSNINVGNKDKVIQSIECKLAKEFNKPITEDIRKQLIQAINFNIMLNELR